MPFSPVMCEEVKAISVECLHTSKSSRRSVRAARAASCWWSVWARRQSRAAEASRSLHAHPWDRAPRWLGGTIGKSEGAGFPGVVERWTEGVMLTFINEQNGGRMRVNEAKLWWGLRRRVLAEHILCFELGLRSRDVIVKSNGLEVSKTLQHCA